MIEMDQVLAKVKGLRKKPYFKLVSDQSLFDVVTVDLTACIPYNPDHNLDEDAWFKIEAFKQKAFCIDLLKKEADNTLTEVEKNKIVFIRHVHDTYELRRAGFDKSSS